MKKTLTIMAALLAAAALTCISCVNEEEDSNEGGSSGFSYETPTAELPESSGENELAGKSFSYRYDYNTWIETWTFDDSTITRVRVTGNYDTTYSKSAEKDTYTYRYTYNSETKTVSYSLISYKVYHYVGDAGYLEETFSSVNDFAEYISNFNKRGNLVQLNAERAKAAFSCVYSFKYTLSDNTLVMERCENYFPGTVPCGCGFSGDILTYSDSFADFVYPNGLTTSGRDLANVNPTMDGLLAPVVKVKGESTYHPTDKLMTLEFGETTFTGTVFEYFASTAGRTSDYYIVGTVTGTYETTGSGYEECTLTLTFTGASSEEVTARTALELNKSYTLTRPAVTEPASYATYLTQVEE